MGTRVLRPSLRTVRSVLPASSSSAKDLAARHGFYFRVTVVFGFVLRTTLKKSVTLQESSLPAAYSKSPNTPYALYTPYLFLVFAEYTPILLPILQRKHSLSICQEQSHSTLRTLLRTALHCHSTLPYSFLPGSCLYRHLNLGVLCTPSYLILRRGVLCTPSFLANLLGGCFSPPPTCI